MTLSRLLDPDAEDIGLRHARERQTHQEWKRTGLLYGIAIARLAELESDPAVWTNEEVAAHDERVLRLVAELMEGTLCI